MNTKEAIEFLEKKNISDDELLKMKIKSVKRLAKLLQRGEKYEAMWEEVETLFTSRSDRQGGESLGNNILRNMEDIKQKYFPKPSKNFTEKVMEKIKKGGSQ